MNAVRSVLRRVFSSRVLGCAGIAAGLACIALSIAFMTVWSPIINADARVFDRGLFRPFTTKAGMAYCGVVLILCSVVTMNLWNVRRRLAVLLGEQWKLTTALAGILLITSVLYFLHAFTVTHLNFMTVHPERANMYYASFFGYDMLFPALHFSREDIFSACFMSLSGLAALGMFVFLSLNAGSFRSKLPGELWGMMGFGFLFLAADELFDLHRFLGRNLPFLRDMSIHSEPGHIVFGFYGIIAVALVLAYRKELLSDRAAGWALLFGALLQCFALGFDMWGKFQRREEVLEIGEAALWFVAIIYYAYDELESYIEFRTEHSPRGR